MASDTGVWLAQQLMRDFGLSPAAAAGFAGNLDHESGGFAQLQELNPVVPGSRGGFGWAQWTGPRRRQFEAWSKQNNLDPSSPEANYGFLKHELTDTPEDRVLGRLQGVSDPGQAAQIVSNTFLRPGIPHMQSRVRRSEAIASALSQPDGRKGMESYPSDTEFTGSMDPGNMPLAAWDGDSGHGQRYGNMPVQSAGVDPAGYGGVGMPVTPMDAEPPPPPVGYGGSGGGSAYPPAPQIANGAPKGLLDILKGGGDDKGGNLLSMLAAGQPQQTPQAQPMPQQPNNVPALSDIVNQFIQSRMRA